MSFPMGLSIEAALTQWKRNWLTNCWDMEGNGNVIHYSSLMGWPKARQKYLKKIVGTCGRAVSVGGVIQFTDHVGRGGVSRFFKKICRGWLTHLFERITICEWHDSVSEINCWCLMCGGPTGKTNEYCVVLDASLHHMWSTNSTHDFPMNPVGSLQDILINFTGLPSDSIRVPRGCQYGIFGSSRIPFGFPWGSYSLLIWFLWTLRISKCSPWDAI